jgi:hypothetical protein
MNPTALKSLAMLGGDQGACHAHVDMKLRRGGDSDLGRMRSRRPATGDEHEAVRFQGAIAIAFSSIERVKLRITPGPVVASGNSRQVRSRISGNASLTTYRLAYGQQELEDIADLLGR